MPSSGPSNTTNNRNNSQQHQELAQLPPISQAAALHDTAGAGLGVQEAGYEALLGSAFVLQQQQQSRNERGLGPDEGSWGLAGHAAAGRYHHQQQQLGQEQQELQHQQLPEQQQMVQSLLQGISSNSSGLLTPHSPAQRQ